MEKHKLEAMTTTREPAKSSTDRKWEGSKNKCGKTKQTRDEKCPEVKASYDNCLKMGPWATVCRKSRSVNEATETEKGGQTSYFVGLVFDVNERNEAWTVQLSVDSIPVEFKINTGADGVVI